MAVSELQIIMMYHTQLRNVGLFSSLGYALLAIARFYRGKGADEFANILYAKSFGVFSSIFISLSIVIAIYLTNDQKKIIAENDIDSNIISKWHTIPYTVVVFNSIILCFILYNVFFKTITWFNKIKLFC